MHDYCIEAIAMISLFNSYFLQEIVWIEREHLWEVERRLQLGPQLCEPLQVNDESPRDYSPHLLSNCSLRSFIRKRVWALVRHPQDWQWYLFCSSRVSVLKNSLIQSKRSTAWAWDEFWAKAGCPPPWLMFKFWSRVKILFLPSLDLKMLPQSWSCFRMNCIWSASLTCLGKSSRSRSVFVGWK